jgi:hypothetical protein
MRENMIILENIAIMIQKVWRGYRTVISYISLNPSTTGQLGRLGSYNRLNYNIIIEEIVEAVF